MAGKALLTLDGIGKELDPELDVLGEAQPYFVEYLKGRFAPDQLAADLARGAVRYAGMARDVPFHLREVLDDLRMGRLSIKTAETELGPSVDRLGRRVLVGSIFVGLQIGGGLAFGSSAPDRLWVAVPAFVSSWLVLGGYVLSAVLARWLAKPKA
jgi:ubiquinone biosynthesis protein